MAQLRHTLGTPLRAIGTDIKVAQDLLRHANNRTTLDIYTHAVSQQKRGASTKVVESPLLPRAGIKGSALSPLKKEGVWVWKWFVLMELLVDLIGIEPMTSSMPWNDQRGDLLTVKDL
jgi:hypothetical protein